MNILADQNMRGVQEYFGKLGAVRLVDGRGLGPGDLHNVDVLLVRSVTQVNESLLKGTGVKFVGTATSGFDHIDLDYLEKQNIGFSHAPGSNANSVVEYVLSAIASVEHKLEALLAGEAIGIVGYGHVGAALAARCAALGIAYCIYDPLLPDGSVSHPASLEEVLGCSMVSLHPALTKNGGWPSYHLLAADQLAGLSSDTLIINASRGAVVDNNALLELLRSGRGPTAVLDVWEGEPAINAELLSLVELGSAHIAGYSLDGKFLATRMLRDAILQYFAEGDKPDSMAPESTPPIKVPAELSGAGLLRWLVQSKYDIRTDDRLLREAIIAAPASQRVAAFDQLRGNYRERRELFGSIVELEQQDAEQQRLLQALGCAVAAPKHHL